MDPGLGVSLFTTVDTAVSSSKKSGSRSGSGISSSGSRGTATGSSSVLSDGPGLTQTILSLLDRFPEAKLLYLHYLVDEVGVEVGWWGVVVGVVGWCYVVVRRRGGLVLVGA